MYAANGTGDSVVGLLPLLWVFMLMAAVVITITRNRMNRQMTKRIGLELEVIKQAHARESPNQKLATWLEIKGKEWRQMQKESSLLHKLKVRFMGYTHEVISGTKIVTDSSLNSGGIEIVSPPLEGNNADEWIDQIAYGLKGVANVDSSTGLHLHIGLRAPSNNWSSHESDILGLTEGSEYRHGFYLAKAVLGATLLTVALWQPVYNRMVAKSRRNGQWSRDVSFILGKSFVSRYFHEHKENGYDADKHVRFLNKVADYFIGNGDRYYCVNSQAFERYGTIEFRSHQGTTNARKIKGWVDMHYLLVQRCTNESWLDILDYNHESITDFFGFLGVSPSDDLFRQQVRRIRKLNPNNLNTVFQHDPQLGLEHLFQHSDSCSVCKSTTCDHDDECGSKPSVKLGNQIARHFVQSRHMNCDNCGEYSLRDIERGGYDIDWYDNHADAYCPSCDTIRSFSMSTTWLGGLFLSLMFGISPMLLLTVGCGIGAIHVARRKFRERNLATKLLRALQVRGGQAAGYAFNKGKQVFYLKMARPASYVANKIRKDITPKETNWWLGHTRFATHGANNDKNAHPHFSREVDITLVHNGVVHNHDDVWKALGQEPTGEVDSQAVAQCLQVGGIEEVVKHCEGSMSLIWHDKRSGEGTLKCWTNGGNPLVMGRIDDSKTGAVVIASTEAILKQAVGKRLKTSWDATIGREYTIQADGTITKRDIEGSEATAGITYDWRTYTYLPKKTVTKGGKQTPVKKQSKPKPVRKYKPRPPRWVVDQAKSDLELGEMGFPSRAGYHGYDAKKHMGVRPDGGMYDLPQYLNPYAYADDLVEVLRGDHEGFVATNWDSCEWRDYYIN